MDTKCKATWLLQLAALAWLGFIPLPVSAGRSPGSGIAGSAHDFTSRTGGAHGAGRSATPCMFCHVAFSTEPPTRHTGSFEKAPDPFPLWGRELTGDRAAYAMYQNGPGAPRAGAKASQAILNGITLGSTSLFCLGCHDGSAAANSYGNTAQLASDRSGAVIGTRYRTGGNGSLANHHPIGFDYDAVQAEDAEIRPADFAKLTPVTTVRDHLYGPTSVRMECGTCHSVHNIGNDGEALLWRSDARSTLCLTCHAKGTYTAPY